MAETFSNVRHALHEAGFHNEATDDAIEAFRKQQRGSVKAPDMVQWCLAYARQPEPPALRIYTAPPPETPIDVGTELYRTPTIPIPELPSVEAAPDFAGMHRAEVMVLTERQAIARTQRRCDWQKEGTLFARIAAHPERMQMFGANVLPPTINEKAPLPNGAVYTR